MRSRFIFSILGMTLCACVHADSLFNVAMADGSTVTIPFADTPEVTYPSAKSIVITSKGETAEYGFGDIVNFYYTKETTTAIRNIMADTKIGGGCAAISGLKDGETVSIYSAAGQVLGTVKADANGNAIINATDFDANTIIVKTSSSSFKIKK